MKNKIFFGLTAINFAVTTWIISTIDRDIVPIHYGISGEADRFGSKWTYLIFTAIPLFLNILYMIFEKRVKNDEGIRKNERLKQNIFVIINIFLILLCWITLIPVIKNQSRLDDSFPGYIIIAVGAFMMYISNYFAKLKQNWYIGIRLPWTLKNETVWKKTHRFGGYTGFSGGFFMIIGGLLGMIFSSVIYMIIGLFAGLILVAIIPSVYSYVIYRKLNKKDRT